MAAQVRLGADNIKNQLKDCQLTGIAKTIAKNLVPFYKKIVKDSAKVTAKKLYDEITKGYVTRGRSLSHVHVLVTDGKNKHKT